MCSKSESGFWIHSEKCRIWRVQIFLRTRKQYPAGSIQTFVQPRRLGKVERLFNQTDVIESCSRERTNTKWKFYKLTNLTVFAALLKDIPMGRKNAVLHELLLRNGTINCLTYEENTRQPYFDNLCLFRALALHLHSTQQLEKDISKMFYLFINKTDGLSPNQFHGNHMNDILTVEDLLTLNNLLYDIDNVDGNIIGELARRSVQKYESTVRLLRYNNHICYVSSINASFKLFVVLIATLLSTEPSYWSDI